MPSENQRPPNAPDPSESRERADPGKEPGMGKTGPTDNTPHDQAGAKTRASHKQSEARRDQSADPAQDQADAVDPNNSTVHGE